MASSLQTAVLGMRAYQEMLNVTGNNIANADTIAFKEDRITFSDMFSRTLATGKRASEDLGGTNPIQIGLGVRVAAVSKNMGQGGFTSTGKDFDLAMDHWKPKTAFSAVEKLGLKLVKGKRKMDVLRIEKATEKHEHE